ncbi:uncharacterized protein L969DRAFT_104740 [Mixia osmundae IAM 14324]|uniref:uncharacterized protein n=1 Tax=Mixia osmundae (strain CBS 9802 / IAM 14324 / JCM 22182 / KY 12970) TaxID=764103 RepID=UPI0004A54F6A|nr:uncharacterized protein L969DRAFT_106158 [Mixia osmundae IAM 14324]XP_014566713.1 uncharacterized protein L969DRAFT_104740 [Mixia osmundae IAM 14324]KEI36182.1 hypothetical protein L969DRAFT_106158 [Mixia osmundae IAM 14324]KEI38150.1 hypothetical protein L969DRAFT_104740 [Mixia osmundae IAM 14324]
MRQSRVAIAAAAVGASLAWARPSPSILSDLLDSASSASASMQGVALAPLYTPTNPSGEFASSQVNNHGSPKDNIIPDSYLIVLKDDLTDHQIEAHHLAVEQAHAEDVQFRMNEYTAQRQSRQARGPRRHTPTDFSASVSELMEEVESILESITGPSEIQEESFFDFEGLKHKIKMPGFNAYSGHFSERVLDAIRASPLVAFVEKDITVQALDMPQDPSVGITDIEKGAPWGLARISHRKPLSLGTFNKYEYAHDGGEGVDVYVIDTGVNINHEELEGRAKWGKTVPLNDVDQDANGHGSHCAGTIASRKYGVAKKANIIAVKVLGSNGSGTMSDVVAGVAWAATSAVEKMKSAAASNGTHKGSVANMSLGGGKATSLDIAVNRAVKAGLHFAVAAGNDNADACRYSPAAAEDAITVGASTLGDDRAYFSNHGSCVDIFAPGLNILSIWNSGNTSTNVISGTSMASPHIAGLAAYFLSLYPTTFSPTAEDFAAAGVPMPAEAKAFHEAAETIELFSFGTWQRSSQVIMDRLRSYAGRKATATVAKPLDPKVLKKSMERLATKGALAALPANTINFTFFRIHRRVRKIPILLTFPSKTCSS